MPWTKAGPTLVDARDKATPLIAQSAALAAEKASQVADIAAEKAAQGKEATAAKAAELSGEPKKKHRLRKLLIITGIAAALGFVAKKLRDGADKENWQSSYTPPLRRRRRSRVTMKVVPVRTRRSPMPRRSRTR